MFCPNCGKDCADSSFCPDCGQPLREKTAEQIFEERRKILKESGMIYCPKCLATSIVEHEQGNNYIGFPFYSTSGKAVALFGMLWQAGKKEKYGNLCVCQKCGHKWYRKQAVLQELYGEYVSKLLGKYSGMNIAGIDGAYLQLREDMVILHLSEKKGCIIPYEELAIVDHRESMGVLNGRLSLRDIAHMKKPFPKTYKAAKQDRFTILYAPEYLEKYRSIYAALKAIAEENKKVDL